MLLTYSVPSFVEDIKNGVKIHSIRLDPKNRWKAGMTIHQWKGNPRNVKNNPYHFQNDVCKSVQRISIYWTFNTLDIIIDKEHYLKDYKMEELIHNDGFETIEHFIKFFFGSKSSGTWHGNLIHWTDKKY